jgi:hypothetical protein
MSDDEAGGEPMVVQGADAGRVRQDEAGHDRPRRGDPPRGQQAGIIALGVAEVVLTALAVADLVRRPRAQVRGPKALWVVGFGVQPFGPATYLLLGRRR